MQISTNLIRAINDVWCQISGDAYDICDGDNQIALELVLDASRLTSSGYPAEGAEASALIKQHGYSKVLESLDKRIGLL
jgi:hypothetical protein